MCLCAVSTWRRAFSPKPTRTKPRLSGTDNLIGCTRRSCGEGRVSSFTGFGSFRELLCHPRWRARPAVASFAHAFARPRVRVFFSEGLAGHTLGGGVQRLHMGGARSGRLPSAVCCRPGSTGVAAPRNAAETLSYGPGPVPPSPPPPPYLSTMTSWWEKGGHTRRSASRDAFSHSRRRSRSVWVYP